MKLIFWQKGNKDTAAVASKDILSVFGIVTWYQQKVVGVPHLSLQKASGSTVIFPQTPWRREEKLKLLTMFPSQANKFHCNLVPILLTWKTESSELYARKEEFLWGRQQSENTESHVLLHTSSAISGRGPRTLHQLVHVDLIQVHNWNFEMKNF